MTNIPVLGWYHQKNVGDEAFKDVFRAALRDVDPSATISFHTPFSALKSPLPDKVILGGGDVIRPFYLEKIPPEVKIFPLGVGLGYESEIELLAKANIPFALFRNLKDVELAHTKHVNARYCPDLTFYIKESEKYHQVFNNTKKGLGVFLSDEISPTFERRESKDYLYYEYFKWELASILDLLSEFSTTTRSAWTSFGV